MVDQVQEPIVVTSAQGITDAVQAALRYLVVIFGFLSGLSALIGKGDAVAAMTYVQTNLGGTISAIFGLVALGTAAYGVYKTWKRGAQLSTAAAEPNHVVSDQVLTLKKVNR